MRRFLRFFVAQVGPAITGTATARDTSSSSNERHPLNWVSAGLLLGLLAVSQFGLLLICVHSAQAGQKVYPKTEEALKQAVGNLNWESEPKKYALGESHAEYPLQEGLLILRGEDARQFMRENTLASETEIATESLRYSTDLPGQALGYQMGKRKILDLRSRARVALGDRFDIRRFHEAVLRNGAVPMVVLERQVEWFVEQER